MALVHVSVKTIEAALDAKIKEMRDGYGKAGPGLHVSIEYINGVEDAAEMVSRLIKEAGTDGPS